MAEAPANLTFNRLLDRPVQLWRIVLPKADGWLRAPLDERHLMGLDRRLLTCRYRGAEPDRLSAVLRSGVDVDPPDAVLWADALDKAWEYGGLPKLILAYDFTQLDRACRTLPTTSSREEQDRVAQQFPTRLDLDDCIYFSRLPPDDPRVASTYEQAYGWWIPGNPFEALVAAFLVLRREDVEPVDQELGRILSSTA